MAELVSRGRLVQWISPRRLKDWMQLGLIDSPVERRCFGRGGGRGSVVFWRAGQDALAADLVALRAKGHGVRRLADHVLGRFCLGDPAVPPRQALRALRTWSWPERLGSRRVSGQLARELLAGWPAATHQALERPLIEALKEGESLPNELSIPYEYKERKLTLEEVVAAEARRLVNETVISRGGPLEGERLEEKEREMAELVREALARDPSKAFCYDVEPTRFLLAGPTVALVQVTRALARLDQIDEAALLAAREEVVLPRGSRQLLSGAAGALLTVLGCSPTP
jgi:hypothetical protein